MRSKFAILGLILCWVPLGANCFLLPSQRISSPSHILERKFIFPSTPTHAMQIGLSSNPFLHSPLAMTSTTSSTSIMIRAALTLILSATAGIIYDKKRGGGLGTLITLLVAVHASNLNLGPSHHFLYDFCWTTLLPSSLALLLLASPSAKDRQSSRIEIRAVAIPFFIASIGSILGCLLSFSFTLFGAMHSSGKRLWRPGRLLLPPMEGAVQAGCLCASFIGGPVNYFGVRHLLASSETLLGHDGGVLQSLFGSSISDLLVMALYFSISTTALNSKLLLQWFPEPILNDTIEEGDTIETTMPFSKRRRAFATALAAFLARQMVKVSVAFGEAIHIPGFMTVSLAGLGVMCSNVLPRTLSFFGADALLQDVRNVSISLSDICFYLLFAAIGASANLKEAVKLGGWHFSSGALFASMALLVHILVLISGSLAIQRLTSVKLGLEEILVASNAAIGGPLTAAEFAKRIRRRRRGLIMAGTVWGVFGYVIATEVGVTLTRLLLPLLPLEWR